MKSKLEIIDVDGCIDCLLYAANGEFHPDNSDHEDALIINAFMDHAKEGYSVTCGDGESFFSRNGCDICDSKLGGDRFPMHLVKNLS